MLHNFFSRVATFFTIAAACALAVTNNAEAFSRSTCNEMFASANVDRVEMFSMNTDEVSLGDHPHLLGTPLGSAVVCWSNDGRVAVRGVLFKDDIHDEDGDVLAVRATIRLRRADGRWTDWTRFTLGDGWPSNKDVLLVSPRGQFDEVRILLRERREVIASRIGEPWREPSWVTKTAKTIRR